MLRFCMFLDSPREVWGAMMLQVGRHLLPAHLPHSPHLTPGFGWRDREAAPSLPQCCPPPLPLESSLMDPWTCFEGIICWFCLRVAKRAFCDQPFYNNLHHYVRSYVSLSIVSSCCLLPQFTALRISHLSYLRVWQLLLKLYLLPWFVVFSSKASKSRALPFDLRGSGPVSRPAEDVVCSAASWSKVLVLPTAFCGWWMESVYVETTAHRRKKVWHGISSEQTLSSSSIMKQMLEKCCL